MKQTIDMYQFRNAFIDTRPDNFSYSGLAALFDHLEEQENECGQEVELDVIAICCEYSEHENIETLCHDHDMTRKELEDHTIIIEFDGGVIIGSF